MSKLLGVPGLLAVCAMVVLMSLLGLALVFLRLGSDIDGLFLLIICLMMGGIFSLMLFAIAKESGLLPARQRKAAPTSGGAAPAEKTPAAGPAAAKSAEEKS